MERTKRRSGRRVWASEGLEARNLPAVGIAGLVNELRELGAVSVTAAVAGVEATAMIPAHSSVTFGFEVEDSGHYLLLVRHTGDDFGLTAAGPSGSATIDPGPEGPFSTVPLTLKAATYEVTASANGDQPVFVDWEFLIVSGIGQSAAISTSLASPTLFGPASTSAPTLASVPALAPAPTPVSVPTGASSAAPATVVVPVSSASAALALAGPIGRPGLEPSDPASTQPSSRPVPEGPVPRWVVDVSSPADDLGMATILPIEGGVGEESAPAEDMGVWGRMVGHVKSAFSPIGNGRTAGGEAIDTETEGRTALAGVRPDLVAVAVIIAVASRKKIAKVNQAQRFADPSRMGWSTRPHFQPRIRSRADVLSHC